MSTIAQELAKLELSARIELFVIDSTSLGGEVLRFHNGTNQLSQPVVWQGHTYQPMPVQADGFETRAEGPAPRPRIRVSNVFGLVGLLLQQYGGLEGATVTRKLTLACYLDAVNFEGGINPTANPDEHYPDDVWIVDRVSRDDAEVVEWELASPLDLEGVKVPARRCNQLVCAWQYRSANCGYTGGAVAKADDTPTANPALDECGLLLSSCRLRFGKVLPFGGFPGAGFSRAV
jgi:lambda family phage minor tail protein L